MYYWDCGESSLFSTKRILVDNKDKYLWIDSKDKQIHIEDISDLITQEPTQLWWEANDDKIIYVYYPNQINRIDIKAKAIYPDISPKSIPTLKKNAFQLTNFKGSIGDEVKNSWLIYTANKSGLWDNSQKSLQWIFQKGRNIQQVFWANNAGTILFRDNNQIFLLDKEILPGARMQKITTIKSGTPFLYSEKTGKIYFIDPQENFLSTVQILQHNPIIPKNISDKLRLKDFKNAF